MKTRSWIALLLVCAFVGAAGFLIGSHYSVSQTGSRSSLLASLPSNANKVLYLDLSALRNSLFLAKLYSWAPQFQADPEYLQFVRESDFHYERDLDQLAVCWAGDNTNPTLLLVADGRFRREKISAVAAKSGTKETTNGREFFAIPAEGGSHRVFLTFPGKNRIAIASDDAAVTLLGKSGQNETARQWQERFTRLAGSPIFAVIRQDGASQLALQAPGGLQSPQLASLLNQLSWITIAGQPDGNNLRVVAEGETPNEGTARQLADMLNGLLVMAQAGLAVPRMESQLGSQVRDAYLELLRSANISRIDRGDTKAVRLVFEVTPNLLDAMPSAPLPAPPSSAPKNTDAPQKKTPESRPHPQK